MDTLIFNALIQKECDIYAFAKKVLNYLHPGDIVLLEGPLGAGKTTFVRGILESLGYLKSVRSPTFNLIQTFDTHPPIMHADLYRLEGAEGIGLEDYFETHLCLIEWGEKAEGWIDPAYTWKIKIDFAGHGRSVLITPPQVETTKNASMMQELSSFLDDKG